jgi:DNA-binding transcriptional regulator YdaS (Cro superfamily)
MVNQWVRGTRPVPVRYCLQIEKTTGVSRQELRPNDWEDIWPELADTSKRRRKTDDPHSTPPP